MLEFLYTGDYTVKNNKAVVRIPPSGSKIVPEPDTCKSEEALRVSQKGQAAMENLSTEDNFIGVNTVTPLNQTTASLVDHSPMEKKSAVVGGAPLKGTSEQI